MALEYGIGRSIVAFLAFLAILAMLEYLVTGGASASAKGWVHGFCELVG